LRQWLLRGGGLLLPFPDPAFIDWRDKDAVHAFYLRFITMLCKLNSLQFDLKAFDEAFSVFIQYIKALKILREEKSL